MWKFLKAVFGPQPEPKFEPNTKVNRLEQGCLDRCDGQVIAQTSAGVLVEWPRHGARWENAHNLCAQG